jgi:phosphonate transport system substrate-binding protein
MSINIPVHPLVKWLLMTIAVIAAACWQPTARAQALIFAVNEGVTYQIAEFETRDKYKDVADDLSKLLKRTVTVQVVNDYKVLSDDLAAKKYDLAYIHPAHHAIRAMKQNGYKLVALTKGFTEYRASFLVPASSTAKSLADLKGQTVGAPAEDSITSVLVRASLKDALGVLPKISYTRYQDAVPFMVEHGMAAAGASASNTVVKDWLAKGGRVLATTKSVPIKQILASSKLTDEQRAQVTAYFVGLDTTATGRARLKKIGFAGFSEFDEAVLLGISAWLGL